jgi:uncharacterized protein (UPF0276 family)
MPRPSVGIGLRDPYVPALKALTDRSALDVLEVMIDDALFDARRMDDWRALSKRWPLVAHGTSLGPGDANGLDPRYLSDISRCLRAVGAQWYSEHLCFLRSIAGDSARDNPLELGHFGPLWLDDADLAVLARNVDALRAQWPGTFLLENPADVLGLAGEGAHAGRESGRRFRRALEAARCGALLDLTNLALQGRNDGFDPAVFLDELDWDRVIEVHLAGGRAHNGLWIDSHDHPVDEEAWSLLAVVRARAPNLRAVIIERDDRLPTLDVLLAEVIRARRIVG